MAGIADDYEKLDAFPFPPIPSSNPNPNPTSDSSSPPSSPSPSTPSDHRHHHPTSKGKQKQRFTSESPQKYPHSDHDTSPTSPPRGAFLPNRDRPPTPGPHHDVLRPKTPSQSQSHSSKSLRALFMHTSQHLASEKSRADTAEHALSRLRSTLSTHTHTLSDNARLTHELHLYKIAYEAAQTEIRRAQGIVDAIQDERDAALVSVRRERGKVRKLVEERATWVAREEGWNDGFREGMERGKLIAAAQRRLDDDREEEEEIVRGRVVEQDIPPQRVPRRLASSSRSRRTVPPPRSPSRPLPVPVPFHQAPEHIRLHPNQNPPSAPPVPPTQPPPTDTRTIHSRDFAYPSRASTAPPRPQTPSALSTRISQYDLVSPPHESFPENIHGRVRSTTPAPRSNQHEEQSPTQRIVEQWRSANPDMAGAGTGSGTDHDGRSTPKRPSFFTRTRDLLGNANPNDTRQGPADEDERPRSPLEWIFKRRYQASRPRSHSQSQSSPDVPNIHIEPPSQSGSDESTPSGGERHLLSPIDADRPFDTNEEQTEPPLPPPPPTNQPPSGFIPTPSVPKPLPYELAPIPPGISYPDPPAIIKPPRQEGIISPSASPAPLARPISIFSEDL